MRIAVITTSWPATSSDPAGHFVQAEVRALRREGHEVVVVAPPIGGAFGWPGVAARVRAQPLRAAPAALWVWAARRRFEKEEFDRAIAHWAVPSAWPIVASTAFSRRSRSEPPLEVVSHGGDVRLLAALPDSLRRFVVRSIVDRAERWRFVSESLLRELEGSLDRWTVANVERIASIRPAPLEMPDVHEAVSRRRTALGPLRIAVSVGRLVPGKRVERAIDYVARSARLDALVVVGDGPERARLERMGRQMGVDVRFVGAVAREDALAWIGAADVVLHASQAEGASTVVREARALGRPIEYL